MIIFLFTIIAICWDILLNRDLGDKYFGYLIAGAAELIFFDTFVAVFLGI